MHLSGGMVSVSARTALPAAAENQSTLFRHVLGAASVCRVHCHLKRCPHNPPPGTFSSVMPSAHRDSLRTRDCGVMGKADRKIFGQGLKGGKNAAGSGPCVCVLSACVRSFLQRAFLSCCLRKQRAFSSALLAFTSSVLLAFA
jgi:hypothetical protein